MQLNVLGFQTHRDDFAIDLDEAVLFARISEMRSNSTSDEDFRIKYDVSDNRDWQLSSARKQIMESPDWKNFFTQCLYRPFDIRHCYFSEIAMDYPRRELKNHVLNKENLCLLASRQQAVQGFRHCFITTLSANDCVMSTTSREANQISPLYLYPSADELTVDGKVAERVPNLNMEIVAKFAEKIGARFEQRSADIPVRELKNDEVSFSPENLLDYIYAVLHSPSYREKYKEFLKIDFPRVPLTDDADQFWKFVSKGCELRKLHLMESSELDKPITSYPVPGDNVVEKVVWSAGVVRSAGVSPGEEGTPPKMGAPLTEHLGKVFINPTQYFDNVPEPSWNFYIGGYQPAQKWLKDRKGRKLSYDDILHYQKIIVAIKRTAEVMGKIDKLRKF